jgi:methionine synthase II (cobalamin-independent)
MTTRIKATVVGSYPVPSWLVGNTSRLVLRHAAVSILHLAIRQTRVPKTKEYRLSANC